MSLFDTFASFARGGYKQRPTSYQWPAWVSGMATAQQWGELTGEVDYDAAVARYTESDLVFMCVKRLGDMAADARLQLYPKGAERDPVTGLPKPEGALEPNAHPFYDLWHNPNPQDSKAELLEAIIITLLLSPKGVFIHLDDGQRPTGPANDRRIELTKEPIALWWLLPGAMTVEPDKDTYIKEYLYEMGSQKTHFDPKSIMRIMEFNPLNRYESVSRVQPLNYASATDQEAQKADWALFRNGLRPSAIIEAERDHIDTEELKLMEKVWKERYTGGAEKWHQFIPLWAGFKYNQLTITPEDAQTDVTAKRNRDRVFSVFGVHPGVVLADDVNLANAKVAEHVTRAFTLRPLLRKVSDEINNILPLWKGAPDAEAHFVNVVPQDAQTEAEVKRIEAVAHHGNAIAITNLVSSLGFEGGIEVAREWGLLPDGVDVAAPEIPAQLVEAQSRRHYWPGWKQVHTPDTGAIVPALPPVPLDPVVITQADIDRALLDFYDVFPEFTGLLEAE